VPVPAGFERDIDDRGDTAPERDLRPVGDLATAPGVQQRSREQDRAGPAVHHFSIELEHVRVLVISVDRQIDSPCCSTNRPHDTGEV